MHTHGHAGGAAGATGAAWVGLVVMAGVMALMMAPLMEEPLAIVRGRTLLRRRTAATVEFSFAYTGAWFALSLGLLALLRPTARIGNPLLGFVAACVLVSAWQLCDTRARVAARCRRIGVPPSSGWRSHLGTLANGALEAGSCLRTSGAAMVLMALAPGVGLMAVVGAIHLWEVHPGRDPFTESRSLRTASAYGGLAVSALCVSLLA